MVSKDNRYRQQVITARDGLRKLGMGVVSALLGTTLYWAGAGNNIVKADTTTGNGTGSNQVTSGSSLTGNQAVVLHQNGTQQEAPARSAVGEATTVQSANSVTPLAQTSSTAALNILSGQPLSAQAVAAEKDGLLVGSATSSAAEGDQPVRDTAINSAAVIKPVTSDRQVTSPAALATAKDTSATGDVVSASAAVTGKQPDQGATVKDHQSAAPAIDNDHPNSSSASSNSAAPDSAVKEAPTIPVDVKTNSGQGGSAVISHEQINVAEPARRSPVKQTARVVYLNADDGFKPLASSGDINGQAGTRINYNTTPTLDWLHQAGYQVVENDFDNAPQYFGFNSNEPQVYPITLQSVGTSTAGGAGSPINGKVKRTADHPKVAKGMGATQTALPSNKAGMVFSKSADRQTSLPGKVNAMAFGLLGVATAVGVGVGTTAKRHLYKR